MSFDSSVPDPLKRFPPGSVNGKLLEAILRHRHFVLRVENSVIVDLLRVLESGRSEIEGSVAALAAREGAVSDFSLMTRARMIELERRIDAALAFLTRETLSRSLSDFRRFAEREIEIQNRLMRREIPNGVFLDLTGPDAARVEALLRDPLGGQRWELRMQRNYGEMSAVMKRDLATSVLLGEGVDEAVRRLDKTLNVVGRNRIATLVRSEIQRVANSTAMETYRANQSVVKAVQVWETLDGRTCFICAAKDGSVHPVGSRDLPPYHAACRGFVAPVTRSLEEMGLPLDDFAPTTRASMDGQAPASLRYPEWFDRQPDSFKREWLGPGRYQRYQNGALKIEDLSRGLRILPINELPAMSLGAA